MKRSGPAARARVRVRIPEPDCASAPGRVKCAQRVIHHNVYRCSPRLPPHSVQVLATSFTTMCSHVIPPQCMQVLATSSTTMCTGARHVTSFTT